jgi:hypothetical protein
MPLKQGRKSKAKLVDSKIQAPLTKLDIPLALLLELKKSMGTIMVDPKLHPSSSHLLTCPSAVHENVQPVIHKEIIQPEVVHTTAPIHEVHRAEAEHHGTSVLPMKKMEEFTTGGGILTGGGHKAHETYEGDPKPYNSEMQIDRTDADINFKAHDGLHDHQAALGSSGTGTTTSGPHRSNIANKMDPRVDSDESRSGYGTTARTCIENNTSGAGQK